MMKTRYFMLFEDIRPLIVSENWLGDQVYLKFKAFNQEHPIETVGFASQQDHETGNESGNSRKIALKTRPALKTFVNLPESSKQQVIEKAFKTLEMYYVFQDGKWVFRNPVK